MVGSNRKDPESFFALTSRADIETKSGLGSFVSNTEEVRYALSIILKKYGIQSVVDCPCGDWNWMRLVPLEGIDYLGLDIIPELRTSNRALYDYALIRFGVHDMTADVLPKCDLVICRDILFYLSLDNITAIWSDFALGEYSRKRGV